MVSDQGRPPGQQASYQPSAAGSGGAGGGALSLISNSAHPTVAVFHYAFKIGAVLMYIFGGLVSANFVFVCVVCILLLAFDFWTVKNVSGRLMVGLRWWSNVKDDGTNDWRFESVENLEEISPIDRKLFWWGLYLQVLTWGALFIVGLLKFNVQWLVIVVIAMVLGFANIIGYTKCSNDAKQRIRGFMQEGASRGALAALGNAGVRDMMLSLFSGGRGGSSGSSAGGAPAPGPNVPYAQL